MWLLNVRTRRLEDFMDDREVFRKYAILSHTWGSEEVTFQEIHLDSCRTKEGYRKIDFACRQALSDGLDYLWCDTCCIDKKSSAELSEAINSMYRWYHDANICYAYLYDFNVERLVTGSSYHLAKLDLCRWFWRGWTLQELIAPPEVIFYDQKWVRFAKRSSIAATLSDITDIDEDILRDRTKLEQASVAKRMSFAAKRSTTRVEDQAYSLLGIFRINMPLLYGEGKRAFKRLQEEIIRTWTNVDHSILAWHGESDGLLADSPALFPARFPPHYWKFEQDISSQDERPAKRDILSWSHPQNETFELTNKGLRITLYARAIDNYGNPVTSRQPLHLCDRLQIALNCSYAMAREELFGMSLQRRPWVDNEAENHPGEDTAAEFAIYDFDLEYNTVPVSELADFETTTVTIARTPYLSKNVTRMRLVWEASRSTVQEYYPEAAWGREGSTPALDLEKLPNTQQAPRCYIRILDARNECLYLLLDFEIGQVGHGQLGGRSVATSAAMLAIGTTRSLERRMIPHRIAKSEDIILSDEKNESALAASVRLSFRGGEIVWILTMNDYEPLGNTLGLART